MPLKRALLWMLTVCLVTPLAAQDEAPTARLLVSTKATGVQVRINGQDYGVTPASINLGLPGGKAQMVTLELLVDGKVVRLFQLGIAPGETYILDGLNVSVDLPTETVWLPQSPGGAPTPAPPALDPNWPPAGWPPYLMGKRPPAGVRTRVATKDGMPQAWIPTAEFTMGSSPDQIARAYQMSIQTGPSDQEQFTAEGPSKRVTVSGYWLDMHEVTYAQYCRFLNETKPDEERRKTWLAIRGEEGNTPFISGVERVDGVYRPTRDAEDYPAAHVSWYGATAYATWAGRRLPSAAEWERAARANLEGGFFAWPGEAPPPLSANLCDLSHVGKFKQIKRDGRYFIGYDDGHAYSSPVCTFAANALGVYDLIGNLWEWCEDDYDAAFLQHMPLLDPVNRTPSDFGKEMRGGGFLNAPWSVRPACRLWGAPDLHGNAVGFRCAQSQGTD